MNEENTRILVDTFPRLYRDLLLDKPQQVIGYRNGFECGDGWFQLIFDLSTNIEKVASKLGIDPASNDWPEAVQVKEKFGGLRYYIRTADPDGPIPGNADIQELCRAAENRSLYICEDCGAPGTFRRQSWMRITCDACEEKRESKKYRARRHDKDDHENWLHRQVAPAYDALKIDPSRAITADQVRTRLAADQDLIYRLRKRAEIRRQIQSRKSVQEGKPDSIADLLEEAAAEIERLHELVDDGLRRRLAKMNLFTEQEIADIVLEDRSIQSMHSEDMKIQSMQRLKGEMLAVARGEQQAPTDAGNTSFESTDALAAHGRDIAKTGIAGAEFDPTNPDKKTLTDVLPKFSKFSPDFMAEGRGDQEQAAPKLRVGTTSNWEGMPCHTCGAANLIHGTRDMPYTYKGQSTIIRALTCDYCPACLAIFLDLDEARRAMEMTLEFQNRVDREEP